jgi:hypothetical protein
MKEELLMQVGRLDAWWMDWLFRPPNNQIHSTMKATNGNACTKPTHKQNPPPARSAPSSCLPTFSTNWLTSLVGRTPWLR